MINDYEALLNETVTFLKDLASKAGTKNFVVGVSGGVDSAVTLMVAGEAAKELGGQVVGVLMPCHSSQDSLSRGNELISAAESKGLPIVAHQVNLEAAYASILDALPAPENAQYAHGSLRSCLRAPVLDYVAKIYPGLVVGTGNRDEDEIFRYYQKRGDGAVDCNPIATLHKSEVWAFAEFLGVPGSIIEAVPSADLWEGQTDEEELGITYKQIEWVTREEVSYGVVFYPNFMGEPFEAVIEEAEMLRGAKYTEEELELIKQACRAEMATRHKSVPPASLDRDDLVNAGILG